MAWLRFPLYFLLISVVIAALVRLEVHYPGFLTLLSFDPESGTATSEFSPLELMQPVVIAVCGFLMGWVAHYCPTQKPLAFLFAAFDGAFFLSELDYFLDHWILPRLWQVLVGLIAAILIAYLYRNWRRFQVALGRSWPSPGVTLIFTGVTLVFPVAHLVGSPSLWRSIVPDEHFGLVTVATEEFVELLGYLLLLCGSIEYAYQARSIDYQPPQTAAQRRQRRRRSGEYR